jgi:hypothetical protein
MLLTDLSNQVFEACLNCLYQNVSSIVRTTDRMEVSIGGFVPVVLVDFDHMFQYIADAPYCQGQTFLSVRFIFLCRLLADEGWRA